jgi:SPP1 gp7 family putative phage head morphogenesis protein
MVVGITVSNQDKGFTALVEDGQNAYRLAIAAQVEGSDSSEYWDRWKTATAALLLASWASGALNSLRASGVPLPPGTAPTTTFARDIDTLRYTPPDRTAIDSVTMRFAGGPAREVVERFIRLLPMTREKWESLIAKAFDSAQELTANERANGLNEMAERSPELADLLRGKTQAKVEEPPPDAPESVRRRRTPAVQAVTQGSFFVTGMTQQQVEQAKDILAQAIRGDATVSVAGKKVEEMGIGDFVAHTVLQTGTDLTAARLETVYRTNINRAQSQGRLDICRDDHVRRFVPLMRFRSTKDTRTRETHRKMDGYIATVDQIDRMGIPTPLGFNCRCSWTPVPISTAVSQGFCDEDGNPDFDAINRHNGDRQTLVDKGLVPDVGFISG